MGDFFIKRRNIKGKQSKRKKKETRKKLLLLKFKKQNKT
jgi:hypothetical protein